MPNSNELISKNNASLGSKTDANLANDSNHLGGIQAEDYATKEWVKDYHENKENTLKEDLIKKIEDNLNAAKRYTDDSIKNQDFSNFAENTDLTALDEKLTKQQQNCETKCKENLDKVVEDVNANFEDVGDTLTNLNKKIDDSTSGLNTKYDNLFQSVSNGKAKVAEAITDKGVSTSATATFDTMASNIRSISTGGGGGGGSGIDTSDATATSNDILLGETAYARGEKLTGLHSCLDTSDATATSDDIIRGKSAYVKGKKLNGTLIKDDNRYPTYGTDTSGATATIQDIAFGKTAWANGVLLVGVADFNEHNADVEEIYGRDINSYVINSASIGLVKYADTEDEVTQRFCIAFSKDGNYCVSAVRLNGTTNNEDFAIESHFVDSNGLEILSSRQEEDSLTYKKYRYTKDELGIDDKETLMGIYFGSKGFLNDIEKCILMIHTFIPSTNKTYLHLYSYHLKDNGAIGGNYSNERSYIYNYIIDFSSFKCNYDCAFAFYNTDPYRFLVFGDLTSEQGYANFDTMKIVISYAADLETLKPKIAHSFGTIKHFSHTYTRSKMYPINEVTIAPDDKYLTIHKGENDTSFRYGEGCYLPTDEDLNVEEIYYPSLESKGNDAIMPTDDKIITLNYFGLESNKGTRLCVYNRPSDFTKSPFSENPLKTIYLKTDEYFLEDICSATITPDKKSIIVCSCLKEEDAYSYINIFSVEDILNALDKSIVSPKQRNTINYNISYSRIGTVGTNKIFCNYSGSRIFVYNKSFSNSEKANLEIISSDTDTKNLLGIRYKNQFFPSLKSRNLTALPEDVKSGKTFIGYNAEVENGTLENSN